MDVNEPVDLLQAWGSDMAIESACNNLIQGAHHMVVNGETPVFRYSMSQDLILYQNWVNLWILRGLAVEATDFKRKERTFMYNWQRALTDIKESVRLASKSESEVIKFNAKGLVEVVQVDRQPLQAHARRAKGNARLGLPGAARTKAWRQVPINCCQTQGDAHPQWPPL
jgi:hypothetical protein